MKTVNVILAMAAATAAGVAAGILLAPKKGSDTREDIVDFIKEHCPLMKKNKLQEIADIVAEELGK